MSIENTPRPGLRERKRDALRSRIEETAVRMCLERGYDDVTVEQICDSAEVSVGTFFNYFGTKERAVVGEEPPPLDEDAVAVFLDGGLPIFKGLEVLVTPSFSRMTASHSRELIRQRHRLLSQTPSLLARRMTSISSSEERIVELVRECLGRETGAGDRPASAAVEDRARMIATLFGAALRFTLQSWIESDTPTDTPSDLTPTFALMRDLLRENR